MRIYLQDLVWEKILFPPLQNLNCSFLGRTVFPQVIMCLAADVTIHLTVFAFVQTVHPSFLFLVKSHVFLLCHSLHCLLVQLKGNVQPGSGPGLLLVAVIAVAKALLSLLARPGASWLAEVVGPPALLSLPTVAVVVFVVKKNPNCPRLGYFRLDIFNIIWEWYLAYLNSFVQLQIQYTAKNLSQSTHSLMKSSGVAT